MHIDIITPAHLQEFRTQLLQGIKEMVDPAPVKPGKWIRTEDVMKLLQVSPGSLQNLRVNRTLRFAKIGGIFYYDADHIQKLIKDNVVTTRNDL